MTYSCWRVVAVVLLSAVSAGVAEEAGSLDVGVAVRDITPELPIRLAGYAARTRPADKVARPLRATALALRDRSGARFVFVAVDNCAVSHAFMQPVLEQIAAKLHLERGAVAVVSSHTHSGPVLSQSLVGMPEPPAEDREAIVKYSRSLQARLVEVVGAALDDLQPALLEHGAGRASFAMNRRAFHGDRVDLGENPDGPVDWDVPVLRVKGTNGAVRAVVFGYACHGTSIQNGEEWYAVCSDYMGYACQLIEAHQPGATALYLSGMGADSNPSPRGRLLNARRHGLELAGAVIGVLDRPMRPVRGGLKLAFDEVELPLAGPPTREQLEKDAQSRETAVRQRAGSYLKLLEAGQPLPQAVKLPLAAVRLGDDVTFILMGGEVVVDYARRLKRLLAEDHLWTVGYAYEVPCYIPSARVLKEGGYEAEGSLQYYGLYGPFRASIENLLVNRATAMVAGFKER